VLGLVKADVSEERVASIFRVREITRARKCQTVDNRLNELTNSMELSTTREATRC
jgi:hypothetical protein